MKFYNMTNYKTINNLVGVYQTGNSEATTLLLAQFDKLIKRVAIKYSKKESTLTFSDLYQHGIYVFLKLCKEYRQDTGVNFVGYIKKYFEHTFTDLMCEI